MGISSVVQGAVITSVATVLVGGVTIFLSREDRRRVSTAQELHEVQEELITTLQDQVAAVEHAREREVARLYEELKRERERAEEAERRLVEMTRNSARRKPAPET